MESLDSRSAARSAADTSTSKGQLCGMRSDAFRHVKTLSSRLALARTVKPLLGKAVKERPSILLLNAPRRPSPSTCRAGHGYRLFAPLRKLEQKVHLQQRFRRQVTALTLTCCPTKMNKVNIIHRQIIQALQAI